MSRGQKEKRKRGIPLIAHSNPREVITEQYRLIRSNIMFSAIDKKVKSIMITSSEPAEGKSTTAINLAIVLAQQGQQVLLVDADLRRPSIHYGFQVSNIRGLTSVLTRESELEDTIIRTHIPYLDILTSGTIPPNPSELLNSRSMENLIKVLNENYDFVVYDTPPILAVTDPQILANKCDGVVFVVASGKTHKERALKAKQLLQKAQSRILGVVLNGIETKKGEYYSEYS